MVWFRILILSNFWVFEGQLLKLREESFSIDSRFVIYDLEYILWQKILALSGPGAEMLNLHVLGPHYIRLSTKTKTGRKMSAASRHERKRYSTPFDKYCASRTQHNILQHIFTTTTIFKRQAIRIINSMITVALCNC